MYNYTECGLDNIQLKNGYTEHPDGGISIDNVDGLQRAIASAIAHKSAPLTGREFRFLRIEMDLSQNAIGALMEKTDQTVANWEKGEVTLPRLADVAIRNLYLDSINETPISGTLRKLSELDRQIHEAIIEAETNGCGWRVLAA